jgi:hypothetical protein
MRFQQADRLLYDKRRLRLDGHTRQEIFLIEIEKLAAVSSPQRPRTSVDRNLPSAAIHVPKCV